MQIKNTLYFGKEMTDRRSVRQDYVKSQTAQIMQPKESSPFISQQNCQGTGLKQIKEKVLFTVNKYNKVTIGKDRAEKDV